MITLSPFKANGKVEIPSSKSQTIRALLISLFAREKSTIRHPLFSLDTEAAVSALKALGAELSVEEEKIEVDSGNALSLDKVSLDLKNSGTTLYLLLPLLSSTNIDATFTGDSQLIARPAGPLASSLSDLGVNVRTENGFPPINIKGPLRGGSTVIECKTSQYLSGLLLGCPLAKEDTDIKCSLLYEKPYVLLTLGWLDRQEIIYSITDDLMKANVRGGQRYHGFNEYINGDWSSATFFLCLAAISGGPVLIKGLDKNDPQGDRGVLDILLKMGVTCSWDGNDLIVERRGEIKSGEFDLNAMPDSLPSLAALAAFAYGDTVLKNVPQARIKETNRISVMRENLEILGVKCAELEDGLVIHGKGYVKGGYVKGYSDHRVIMALSILSAGASSDITIDDEKAVSVTYPSFYKTLFSLGGKI